MLGLIDPSRIKRLLCLGAHSDDIELAAGGTILRLLAESPGIEIRWVVFGGNETRQREARESAADFLREAATPPTVETHSFRDAYFPSQRDAIKDTFEAVKKSFSPDVVITHFREDLHQDHRVINELTWNTFRSHAIFEYEVVKYDADLGRPNVFVPLSDSVVEKKIALLARHFASQRSKQWYDADTFKAYLRIKGIECDSPTRWAEAFHARKLLV